MNIQTELEARIKRERTAYKKIKESDIIVEYREHTKQVAASMLR